MHALEAERVSLILNVSFGVAQGLIWMLALEFWSSTSCRLSQLGQGAGLFGRPSPLSREL